MSKYWAKVNNGLVEKVIIANEDFFDTFVDDSAGTWIETKIDGSIRKNYAGMDNAISLVKFFTDILKKVN